MAWPDVAGMKVSRAVILISVFDLSHCRAMCSNKAVITDFFSKLGLVCGGLNLFTKPMQIYNTDETGVNVPGKVITETSASYKKGSHYLLC